MKKSCNVNGDMLYYYIVMHAEKAILFLLARNYSVLAGSRKWKPKGLYLLACDKLLVNQD